MEEVTGKWRKMHCEELQNHHDSPTLSELLKEEEVGRGM